ncbi:unnamed protein product [Leptosia nina]|uniref:Uncharacterized protein n=1 Tax=Leptosia nina TaxID=320188 RepID=A0AAV1JGI8_9NEOP
MREVANFNRYDKFKSKQDDTGRKTQMFAPRSSSSRLSQRFTQKKPSNQSIDLSFTFLMRHNFNDSTRISKHNNTKNVSSRYVNSYVNNYDDSLNNNDLSDFKPVQCSTPKQRFVRDTTITRVDKKSSSYQNRTAKSNSKVNKRVPANKNFNRSFSAKLLDVFNSSCATVVQGFKKVFGKKTNERTIQYDDSCSYSFTNYVRKRQHVGSDEIRNAKEFSSCSTCNNTLELKDKMANDECLKQTIKKLKQGINLFGCDFKVRAK